MGEIIDFGDTKDTLRKRMILLRECLTPVDREKASWYIFDSFFKTPEYINAETIFAFAGFGSEVYTLNAVFKMINQGKQVALPRIMDKKEMEFFQVRKISDIRKNSLKIPEPELSCPLASFRPDIIMMPGVAFDMKFNRLGYGKGYYDRYLTRMGYERFVWKAAIAFSCQVVQRVPHTDNDVSVDVIITEKKVIR